MHFCSECAESCYCDMEDDEHEPPDDCSHNCEMENEPADPGEYDE